MFSLYGGGEKEMSIEMISLLAQIATLLVVIVILIRSTKAMHAVVK